jgi:hypothetical protein
MNGTMSRVNQQDNAGNMLAIFPFLNGEKPAAAPPGKLLSEDFREKADECREKVRLIVAEHTRADTKYRDPEFDLRDRFKQNLHLNTLSDFLHAMSRVSHLEDPRDPTTKPLTDYDVVREFQNTPKAVKRVCVSYDQLLAS